MSCITLLNAVSVLVQKSSLIVSSTDNNLTGITKVKEQKETVKAKKCYHNKNQKVKGEMDIKNLVLLLIDEFGGRITSKTKIHKLCYFYSVIYKKDFGYKPHYYGPYSPKVENAIDELKGIGLLDVNEQSSKISYKGFEVIRYNCSINKFSREVLNKIRGSEDLTEIKKIKDFVFKLKEIGDPDYFELSIAAKAFYILNKQDRPLTISSVIDEIKEFDWHITESILNNAIELLIKLDLIK